jgi:hypothetical protein
MTIHFVYPHLNKISTPHAIGYEVISYLEKNGYKVKAYDLYDSIPSDFQPQVGDILLGHPRWEIKSAFDALVRKKGWHRVCVIHPFCPADLASYAHLYKYCQLADRFIAITGKHWKGAVGDTSFSEWRGKFLQLDLAVSLDNFPRVKQKFNPPNKRKFLFIGNHPHYKNVGFLNLLAGHFPDVEFHRIGPRSRHFKNLIQHGPHALNSSFAIDLISKADFHITMGNADANPTTILEAAAMGLISVAPVGSGYYEADGVLNISGENMGQAIQTIQYLISVDSKILEEKRSQMDFLLKSRYTWIRFVDEVIAEINDSQSINYGINTWRDKCRIYLAYWFSKKSPYRHALKNFLVPFKRK